MEHNQFKGNNKGLYQLIASSREIHSKGMFSYLVMMSLRLIEMNRIIKPHGSIYLHCDHSAGHYLKLVMDALFGKDNFQNSIIWHYKKWSTGKYAFQKNHDTILFYSKSGKNKSRAFNQLYMERAASTQKRFGKGKIVSGYDETGRRIPSKVEGESQGVRQDDVWPIRRVAPIKQNYWTEKPLVLLERIIWVSSNRGDVVFDPFCGCATALIAAEGMVREWVGIDISPKAVELVQYRLKKDLGKMRGAIVVPRDDIPKRTDKEDELRGNALKEHFGVMYGIQRGHCNGCNVHFEDRHLEMDHIIPRAKGGTNHADNFQLLCGNCNRRKGTKTQAEFKSELAQDRGIDTTWI